ncbi:MAG: sensor histidine kinase, partial [Erysipelotrichaceae bacterium]|nr:sensor histidine kinase [Erysipelotrichaceae bacterium]
VENLVDNGLRYAEHNVHIVLKQGYLSVTNDGPSISKERMDKLFKPFEKGSKGKFGLGLSICYKVANAYGYSIEAVNMENGVRFVVNDKNAPKKDRFKMVTEGIRTKIGV